MSKNVNVNPDHYKVAGRERQGEDIVQSAERRALTQQQAESERWQAKKSGPARPSAVAQAARGRSRRKKT